MLNLALNINIYIKNVKNWFENKCQKFDSIKNYANF